MTEKTRYVFDLCLEIDRMETERRELEAGLTPEERDDLDDALQIYADTQGVWPEINLQGNVVPNIAKLEGGQMTAEANNPAQVGHGLPNLPRWRDWLPHGTFGRSLATCAGGFRK